MKRRKGEGMVRERSRGLWEARITINGTKKSFYGKSENEAMDKMNAHRLSFESPPVVLEHVSNLNNAQLSALISELTSILSNRLQEPEGSNAL